MISVRQGVLKCLNSLIQSYVFQQPLWLAIIWFLIMTFHILALWLSKQASFYFAKVFYQSGGLASTSDVFIIDNSVTFTLMSQPLLMWKQFPGSLWKPCCSFGILFLVLYACTYLPLKRDQLSGFYFEDSQIMCSSLSIL